MVVSGTVIDSETRQPVARAVARLIQLSNRPEIGWPGIETTDVQGRFAIKLPPARVPATLRIEPGIWTPSLHYLTKFSDDDAEKTDEDYQPVFPMGGDKPENALPLTTSSGFTLQVPLRKITYRRVALHFDATPCAQNDPGASSLQRESQRASIAYSPSPEACAPI